MFDLPKPILHQLLTVRNTRPDTLTTHEKELSDRICFCTLCDYIWVRRLATDPDRCPHCHKLGWNRPLINAMLAATQPTVTSEVVPPKQLTEPNKEGTK